MPTIATDILPKRPRTPRSRALRRLLAVGLFLLGIFVLFEIVAPFLISNALIRDQMERVVEDWTGNEATIHGTPKLRFWPQPRISLPEVTIERNDGDGKNRLLAHVGRVSARFNLLEAVLGRPVFTDFRLTNTEVFVTRNRDGKLEWTRSGLLHNAVANATSATAGQSLDAADDRRIGSLQVRNGAITVTNEATGSTSRISDMDGRVDWPYLSRAASVEGRATIGGRQINVSVDSTELLLLFAGKNSNTSGTLASDLFSGSFDGIVNLAAHGFLSGDAQLSVPDMQSLLAWSGRSFPGSSALKSLSFKARLITNPDALRFEHLLLTVNAREANGILDLTLPKGAPPRFTGTLALKDVDIFYLISQVAPQLLQESEPATQPSNRFELDLRLSAQNARLGPFLLNEVAMGVMNVGTQARMDILDSDFEGGRLTGRIATTKDGENGGVALRLSAQNADFADVIAQLGLNGPLPAAKGSLEISLDAPRPLTDMSWRNARGSVHFTADGGGVIGGINLAGIKRLADQQGYFPLSLAGAGPLEFKSMDISASLSGGSAEIHNGQISSTAGSITLNGIVPYVNNSLALSATLTPAAETGAETAPMAFFVGGSWPDPIIWPIREKQPKLSD